MYQYFLTRLQFIVPGILFVNQLDVVIFNHFNYLFIILTANESTSQKLTLQLTPYPLVICLY